MWFHFGWEKSTSSGLRENPHVVLTHCSAHTRGVLSKAKATLLSRCHSGTKKTQAWNTLNIFFKVHLLLILTDKARRWSFLSVLNLWMACWKLGKVVGLVRLHEARYNTNTQQKSRMEKLAYLPSSSSNLLWSRSWKYLCISLTCSVWYYWNLFKWNYLQY